MKTLNIKPGTHEYDAAMLDYFTDNQAPAMLGICPLMSRDDLIQYKKNGVKKTGDYLKPVQWNDLGGVMRSLYGIDVGRIICVSEVGNLDLLASIDGISANGEVIFTFHFLTDEMLHSATKIGDCPDNYLAIIEHQLIVTGAKKSFFVACRPDVDDKVIFFEHYISDAKRKRIIDGWVNFKKDLEVAA